MAKDVYIGQEEPEAPSRGPSKVRLLDNTDQNIGNSETLAPYPDADSLVPTTVALLDPPRLLYLDSLSPNGQMVTVGLTASAILEGQAADVDVTPITGIIEFGNGSVFTRIEVDIPIGRTRAFPIGGGLSQFVEPEDGVTLVSVPAGTLRVYARNDSKMITPSILGNIGSLTTGPSLPPITNHALSAKAKAFVTYLPARAPSILPTKTYYIGRAGPGGGDSISFSASSNFGYLIPPLAKRFRILRTERNPLITMPAVVGRIFDPAGHDLEFFSIPVNTPSPWFDIPGPAQRVSLSMTIGAHGLAAIVFEIGA